MTEQQRTNISNAGAGSASAFWDDTGDVETSARVAHGLHQERLPVVGMAIQQVRQLFGARLGIGPDTEAFLDGSPAGENTTVRAGQVLSFSHRTGEKGIDRRAGVVAASASVTIEGEVARATSPEGSSSAVPLSRLLDRIAPSTLGTGELVLPDGVRAVCPMRQGAVVVHQLTPRVANLRWIAGDSKQKYGPGTSYRSVRVALPYIVVLAVFTRDSSGRLRLTNHNEAFFTNNPVGSLDDPLCYPALLNCSRFQPTKGRPLSWICTQHLDDVVPSSSSGDNDRVRYGLSALLHHLLETGFNESSEHHEHSSWFAETIAAEIDPRLTSIESWEEATAQNPLFVLDVPWLPTGKSVREVVERIRTNRKRRIQPVTGADELARVIFNAGDPTPGLFDEEHDA